MLELQALLGAVQPGQTIRAVPGTGPKVPLWILGSSTFGAQLAATLGLPFAFASHFAPQMMMPALREYRARFEPSAQLDKPYAMVGVNVFAADSDVEAQRMFSSLQQQFINLRRGTPGPLPPPVDDMDALWSPAEKAMVGQSLSCSAVGSPAIVEEKLRALIADTAADELMTTGQIYDHAARLRSFEIAARCATGWRVNGRCERSTSFEHDEIGLDGRQEVDALPPPPAGRAIAYRFHEDRAGLFRLSGLRER